LCTNIVHVCVNTHYIYEYIQNCIVMLNNKYCICYATSCHVVVVVVVVVVVDDDNDDNDNSFLYY